MLTFSGWDLEAFFMESSYHKMELGYHKKDGRREREGTYFQKMRTFCQGGVECVVDRQSKKVLLSNSSNLF